MNILLLTSHSIAEYDDLRMLTDLGHDVFSIGAYTEPAHPSDDKRPALPDVPHHADLAALCVRQRELHGEASWAIDWAKADLAPELIDWADAVIVHHFPERWIVPQWDRLRRTRVIWRTCGQSNPDLEALMRPLHHDGLQIVRYSPCEAVGFERLGSFAGEDALIRFGKYPADWTGWDGSYPKVINISQHLRQRGEATHADFWDVATDGLPAELWGPGSDNGTLTYDEMRRLLRRARAYLYTGTQPASYTLGLIEAAMTGTPVVAIGRNQMWYPDLYEGEHFAEGGYQDPKMARWSLTLLLADLDRAERVSREIRARAVLAFGMDTIGPRWTAFLAGRPLPADVDVERIRVPA